MNGGRKLLNHKKFTFTMTLHSIIVSPKSGDTMDHVKSSSTSTEIFCVQPTIHLSFGISFKLGKWGAMAEIWPAYCFGSTGVQIMLLESKTSKFFIIACVQAIGPVSFRFILYLVQELVGMMSRHPIFFVGL